MRYIGNKNKLLPFIDAFLDDMGIERGRALDAFAGTATVGRYLKSRGMEVVTCDILSSSYAFQRAYVVTNGYPSFSRLIADSNFQSVREDGSFQQMVESRFAEQEELFDTSSDEARALKEVLVYLDTVLASHAGFITKNYSAPHEGQEGSRMYFTEANARCIDMIRGQLHTWQKGGSVDDDEFHLLLACLLEAADSVANTTGVYAAFVKTWQSNALRPLKFKIPLLVSSDNRVCEALQGDVNQLIPKLGSFDLLYLDPPYNTRQYSAYYHVPELIAEGWFDQEPTLRGKTGLVPDEHKKSQWSSRTDCVFALEEMLKNADATHVLLSYNNEGIIGENDIERLFKEFGLTHTYQRVGRDYKRYRSDSDNQARNYKGNRVTEYLYYVRLK